ncbi:MAG: CPBP family intramembrane metalloprotease domain-containing protein [Planctomycetaceae bacterium]|nr:CPBP family intramembrane metalloprotease domain-containing protein [Planctomycetaceae bacterium]
MTWRNVKLISLREIRDQLRDRRTLFMVAVLPLFLYPALAIGMVQMRLIFSEQPRTVVLLGESDLPVDPPLLVDGQFNRLWFMVGSDSETLNVISDGAAADASSAAVEVLDRARILRQQDARRTALERRLAPIEQEVDTLAAKIALVEQEIEGVAGKILRGQRERQPPVESFVEERDALLAKRKSLEARHDATRARAAPLQEQSREVKAEMNRVLADAGMDVLVIIPEGFAENIERVNRDLKQRKPGLDAVEDYERPVLVANHADEKSVIALRRVQEAFEFWEEEILRRRLKAAELPDSLPKPVDAHSTNLADDEEIAANLWSKLFPTLLVIMSVTGAFYPAVDLAAGEKERGTMETLLISPALRSELVMGKFLTVLLFSMATAILNVVSMGITAWLMMPMAGKGGIASSGFDITIPPVAALVWVFVLLVPLAGFFSALCLALATFARSTKEGQYYLTPLLMVTLGLTVFCLSPAVEITPFYSVMPVVGIALLLKGMLLSSGGSTSLYLYAIPVLITSVGYSLLALWWAIEQFKREDVLFREAERFELGLWVRHLLRDKESTPSFTEGGFCFVMVMLLQFVFMKYMGDTIANSPAGARGSVMLKMLMVQQLVIIASPALFMGMMLTTSLVRTLQLRMPKIRHLLLGAALPFALHPLSLEMLAKLQWFFPPLPAGAAEAMRMMGDGSEPLWLILLAFAVFPAICEEIAFRGFILSGFSNSGRVGLAIVLSSLTFGIMHMIPQQVFNATLLGLVLGLLAVRSRSLLPCVAFHFVHNSLGVLHSRVQDFSAFQGTFAETFVYWHPEGGGLCYGAPTIVICALAAGGALLWLWTQRSDDTVRSDG